MRKLLKLKEWVTVPEAAQHLSQMLSEPVSETDILQMALGGHIRLSVNFPNTARAKIGKVIPYKDVPLVKLPDLTGKEIMYADGYPLDNRLDFLDLAEDTPFIHFDKKISRIDGTWDLAMKGGERIDIEFELHQRIGGPEVTMINLEGTFLNRPDGAWAALQEQFPDEIRVDEKGHRKKVSGGFYPAGGLIDDCIKVIRTSELIEFQKRMLGHQDQEAPLGGRERGALLNIIGALLEQLNQKDAATISGILDAHPSAQGLSKRNLEEKFAAARRSLKAS